jgi:hypothetical protein
LVVVFLDVGIEAVFCVIVARFLGFTSGPFCTLIWANQLSCSCELPVHGAQIHFSAGTVRTSRIMTYPTLFKPYLMNPPFLDFTFLLNSKTFAMTLKILLKAYPESPMTELGIHANEWPLSGRHPATTHSMSNFVKNTVGSIFLAKSVHLSGNINYRYIYMYNRLVYKKISTEKHL